MEKHPEWTDEECMKVIDKKLWIGMSGNVEISTWGIPDRANPSNYGGGTKWQWCWDDYLSIMLFMGQRWYYINV
jgi:hypothetical protein